ncbi:hypothetical protein OXX69_001304 [Metschnikowia pulcherrima]
MRFTLTHHTNQSGTSSWVSEMAMYNLDKLISKKQKDTVRSGVAIKLITLEIGEFTVHLTKILKLDPLQDWN